MKYLLHVILMAWLATFLVACGVRGDLDSPSESQSNKDEPFILDDII
jgi:hypothetical protein